jgi:hypothetical protein
MNPCFESLLRIYGRWVACSADGAPTPRQSLKKVTHPTRNRSRAGINERIGLMSSTEARSFDFRIRAIGQF